MKEIISAVLLIVGLFAGTHYLKELHNSIRQAALEKAATGLPSLKEMTHSLQQRQRKSP